MDQEQDGDPCDSLSSTILTLTSLPARHCCRELSQPHSTHSLPSHATHSYSPMRDQPLLDPLIATHLYSPIRDQPLDPFIATHSYSPTPLATQCHTQRPSPLSPTRRWAFLMVFMMVAIVKMLLLQLKLKFAAHQLMEEVGGRERREHRPTPRWRLEQSARASAQRMLSSREARSRDYPRSSVVGTGAEIL